MARNKMSIPFERQKAKLKASEMHLKVDIAERKEKLVDVKQQLQAMSPPKPKG